MTDEQLVDITPEELEFPELAEPGWYGPGRDNDADVELVEFAVIRKGSTDSLPGFDRKHGSAQDNYLYFNFRVSSERDGIVPVREWPRYFKGVGWLETLGVPVERYEVEGHRQPGARFNPNEVAPRKVGGIKVSIRDGTQGARFYNVTEVQGN